MSPTIYCVVIACFVVITQSRVINNNEFLFPSDGMTVEVAVRKNSDTSPVSSFKIDVDGQKVRLTRAGPVAPAVAAKPASDFVPSLDNRNGIIVGTCPVGYTRRGGFCFEDDDF